MKCSVFALSLSLIQPGRYLTSRTWTECLTGVKIIRIRGCSYKMLLNVAQLEHFKQTMSGCFSSYRRE